MTDTVFNDDILRFKAQCASGYGMPYVQHTHTRIVSFSDLSAAATTEFINCNTADDGTTWPSASLIFCGFIYLHEEFAGGSVSAVTVELGNVAVSANGLMRSIDVFTGAGTGHKKRDGQWALGRRDSNLQPGITFTSVGGNLNTLTSGSLEAFFVYSAAGDPR